MKKVMKALGILLGVVLIIFIGFFVFLKFKPLPNYSDISIQEINVQADSATLALGKKLVDHNCAGCHRPEGRVYTGGDLKMGPRTKPLAPFISQILRRVWKMALVITPPESSIDSYARGAIKKVNLCYRSCRAMLLWPTKISMP